MCSNNVIHSYCSRATNRDCITLLCIVHRRLIDWWPLYRLMCACVATLSYVHTASELSAATASRHRAAGWRPSHHCWETVSTHETWGVSHLHCGIFISIDTPAHQAIQHHDASLGWLHFRAWRRRVGRQRSTWLDQIHSDNNLPSYVNLLRCGIYWGQWYSSAGSSQTCSSCRFCFNTVGCKNNNNMLKCCSSNCCSCTASTRYLTDCWQNFVILENDSWNVVCAFSVAACCLLNLCNFQL